MLHDTATTEIYTLSLHDALPIWRTFARFGKEVSDEEIRRHIGEGSDDMLPVFFSPEELHRFRRDLEKYRGELFRRRSEEHTSELQSQFHLVCRLLLEKKKITLKS